MSKMAMKKTVWAAGFILLALAWAQAQEVPGLTAEQKFFFETVAARRSVRSFKADAVSDAHLAMILDAARMAASSGNQQPWKFLVVRDRQKMAALKTACLEAGMQRIQANVGSAAVPDAEQVKKLQKYYDTIFTAPLFVVVLVDKQSRYPDYNRFDGPMAVANLMLAARALGYGTVFYTDTIAPDAARRVLRIPERYEQVCITPIGIPSEWPTSPAKKELSDFIVYESF
jgi:nitroreductase